MNNEKVNKVLAGYVQQLCEFGYDATPVRHDLSGPDGGAAAEHALWMCEEALTWGPERLEKKFRWLGFIQGVLWMTHGCTIRELKKDNKEG
jgi:hypothetical protein